MNENNTEFIDVEWFDTGATGQPHQTIGVVLVYNEHAGFKCYIGIGGTGTPEDDMKYIYKYGSKLNYEHAKGIWHRRMRAEWITRHLSDEDLSFYKYDGKKYEAKNK